MKKRILALVLTVSCAVFITACGDSEIPTVNEVRDAASENDALSQDSGEENAAEDDASEQSTQDDTEETKVEETEEASVPNTPATLSDNLYDYQISIDGTVYQFPMWYSDFKALGWEYDGDNTEILECNVPTVTYWKKNGVTATVVMANLSMNAAAVSDCIVGGIDLSKYDLAKCDWELLLPGGIQFGVSTTDDIKAAYGDSTYEYDASPYFYEMRYQYDIFDQIRLFVFEDSGVLERISIENVVALEGADNSVSAEVPDIIKDYQAPAELGNDLYSFHFELEGNLYKLPCPVSEFLANGFTIDESNSDMEIGSGSTGWVALRYNNQTLKVQVSNFADYATTVENCMLTEVKSSDYGPDLALTVPYNIKRGDSEDAVLKAIKGYNVNKFSQDGGYMHYIISEPGGRSSDQYYICVKNGFVHSIEVSNYHMPE